MNKVIYSDHCPLKLCCSTNKRPDLHLLRNCLEGLFSYTHDDIRLKSPVNISKLDIPNVVTSLDEFADQLMLSIRGNNFDENMLYAKIENGIYRICKENLKKCKSNEPKMPHFKNCSSKNFKAIAAMNFYTYNIKRNNEDPVEICQKYLEDWIMYENLALKAEEKELNNVTNRGKTLKKKGGA